MLEQLLTGAKAGELWVDTSLAIESRKAMQDWIAALRKMHHDSTTILKADGFSDIPSAQRLAEKFDKKATNPEGGSGLQERLAQFIAVGEELSELLLLSIRKFEAADTTAADYLAMHGLSDKQPLELKALYQEFNPVEQPR